MKKILIDTDVVLNVLLREESFFKTSSEVFVRLERGDVCGFVTATTMTNIYYIARKRADTEVARICVKKLLETRGLKFLSVDEQVLRNAEVSGMTDFGGSPVPAVLPEEFLRKLNQP